MDLSLKDELQIMVNRFVARSRRWDTVFKTVNEAHERAYINVRATLAGDSGLSTADGFGLASNMFIAGASIGGLAGAVAVPIVYGLEKLGDWLDAAPSYPQPEWLEIKTALFDAEASFRQATDLFIEEISDLHEKATRNSVADEAMVRATVGKMLLSPFWYPPAPTALNTNGLATQIELRMLRKYILQLGGGPLGAVGLAAQMMPFSKGPLPKVIARFKTIGWEPQTFDINKLTDSQHFAKFAAYSEKNKTLNISQTIPAAVKRYMKLYYMCRLLFSSHSDTSWLPASSLNWSTLG